MSGEELYSVDFGPGDKRNRSGLLLDGACMQAAVNVKRGETAKIVDARGAVEKVCRKGMLGPAWFEAGAGAVALTEVA